MGDDDASCIILTLPSPPLERLSKYGLIRVMYNHYCVHGHSISMNCCWIVVHAITRYSLFSRLSTEGITGYMGTSDAALHVNLITGHTPAVSAMNFLIFFVPTCSDQPIGG